MLPFSSYGKESAWHAGDLVQSLGQEDSLEMKMATHSRILLGEFHGQRSLTGYSPWVHKESDTTKRLTHTYTHTHTHTVLSVITNHCKQLKCLTVDVLNSDSVRLGVGIG